MLLLDRVIAFDSESTIAEYSPHDDAWYADEQGNMPAWIGIELMAQTIAAHVGLIKHRMGAPLKMGALLGTRRYTSEQAAFAAGKKLHIMAKMIYRDPTGLGAYECHISTDGEELASGTVKVFEPDDFQTLLQASSS